MSFRGEDEAEIVDDAAGIPNAAGLDVAQQAAATEAMQTWEQANTVEAPPATPVAPPAPLPFWHQGAHLLAAGLVLWWLFGRGSTKHKLAGYHGRKSCGGLRGCK